MDIAPEIEMAAPTSPMGAIVKMSDRPEPSPSRQALVKDWSEKIKQAIGFHSRAFKQIEEDIKFARGEQWYGGNGKKYVANIVQRHLNQRTAALYAKNPKFIARRRKTLDFKVWDGTQGMLQMLQATLSQPSVQPGGMLDPASQELMTDISQGVNKRKMLDRVGKTMEILSEYVLDMQFPPFKSQMKQLVRRAGTCGVGYVKLGFQRAMQPRPEDADKVTDLSSRIDQMEAEIFKIQDEQKSDYSAQIEELKIQLQLAQEMPEVVVKEGPVFDFPRARSIIVDPRCTDIEGFLGAQWVAEQYILTKDDILKIYKVDVGTNFTAFNLTNQGNPVPDDKKCKDRCRVWEIYNKNDGYVYVICEGYNDFLKDPSEPEVKINRFWPWFSITFNKAEDEERLYPQSDVFLMQHQQREYNRSRDGLREHRHANRPQMIATKGILDEDDKALIKNGDANQVIELNGVQPNQKVSDVLQVFVKPPIDGSLYDVQPAFDDIQRTLGDSVENLGGTGDSTATASSIAESSRMSSVASNVDDLQDLLSEMAKSLGEVMLLNMSTEQVQKIVGVGAVWPELTAQDVSERLYLDIEAGSNGRPNKAQELESFQKIMPFLLQIPGVPPDFLAAQAISRLDDRIDASDIISASLPSIIAMNQAQQTSTGNPATDPNQQGAQGANNAQQPPAPPDKGGGSPLLPQ